MEREKMERLLIDRMIEGFKDNEGSLRDALYHGFSGISDMDEMELRDECALYGVELEVV